MVSRSDPAQAPDQARLPAGLENQPWFQQLRDDLEPLLKEGEFTARWVLVQTYHTAGARILQDHDNFERHKIYGREIVQRLAISLGRKPRTLYYAVQFAKKFPSLDKVPEGKAISWHKIITKYLPEHSGAEPPEPEICPYCKRPMPIKVAGAIHNAQKRIEPQP